MNNKYMSNNIDTECEECSSKAEFKKLQLRMGIIIHCKDSKKYHSTFLFRKHPLLLTYSQKSLLFSIEQVALDTKDPEFISRILLETEAFKDILFYEGDGTSAGSALPS